MSETLTKRDIEIILKYLYGTKQMQVDHDTDWTQTLSTTSLKATIIKINECEDSHHPLCPVFKKLFVKLRKVD